MYNQACGWWFDSHVLLQWCPTWTNNSSCQVRNTFFSDITRKSSVFVFLFLMSLLALLSFNGFPEFVDSTWYLEHIFYCITSIKVPSWGNIKRWCQDTAVAVFFSTVRCFFCLQFLLKTKCDQRFFDFLYCSCVCWQFYGSSRQFCVVSLKSPATMKEYYMCSEQTTKQKWLNKDISDSSNRLLLF